ncbi:MAG: PqqD family protein [Propionibacteriaceae bacterium]|nr:PqqD family protein [Propionibacteriaceae bacterium]
MRYAAPDNLAYVVADEFDPDDENVYLMLVPDGHPSILNGTGAFIFLAAVAGDDLIAATAAAAGVPADEVAADVTAFVDDLVQRGYLVPRPDPAP